MLGTVGAEEGPSAIHQAETPLMDDNKGTSGTFEIKDQEDLSGEEIETYPRYGHCNLF